MTKIVPVRAETLKEAGERIRAGELVAFPTETVYGLGADAWNPEAVAQIFTAKGRPGDNPLIVHVSERSEIPALISGEMPEAAVRLADAYWPGPMTLIMTKSPRLPDAVTAGLDTVGIRLPSHPAARALIQCARRPIAAPSANRSGRPSPTTAAHVFEDLNGRIPMILDGGSSSVGLESTVIDARGDVPRILRPGGVTPHMVAAVAGAVEVDGCVLRPVQEGEVVRSPGMKYKHYAPKGNLMILRGPREVVARAICQRYDEALQKGKRPAILALSGNVTLYQQPTPRAVYAMGADEAGAANALFDLLRRMDEIGADAIFAEAVPAEEMGLAVMNRLGRAAGFQMIDVQE